MHKSKVSQSSPAVIDEDAKSIADQLNRVFGDLEWVLGEVEGDLSEEISDGLEEAKEAVGLAIAAAETKAYGRVAK